MTAPTTELDVAARVLERLELELAEPADVDNGLAVAALAIAYDRVKPAGVTHEEAGRLELELATARGRITELEGAIGTVVTAIENVGPARASVLLDEDSALRPIGVALNYLATAIGGTA